MLSTLSCLMLLLAAGARAQQTTTQNTTSQTSNSTTLPPPTPPPPPPSNGTSPRPHIIFIVADDLGWNDVSFHGADQIATYNIDALAYNGVVLNSHYVQPLCTPSRSALMTGKYPIHTGMQGSSLYAAERRALPQGKLLPEYLKDLGYVTRHVGKWHLGFYRKEFTPTFRGFDSDLGYWAGSTSYYDHITRDTYPDLEQHVLSGHDFRRNMDTAWDLDGQYATDIFSNESVRIIQDHNTSTPLFLFLAHLAVHAGNEGKLLEAPQEEINKFRHISDPNRRVLAAMVSKLDESVGQVVEALEARNMLNNSIIVFISDNGAPSVGMFQNWGSNFPLRGIKNTLWEGGVRGVGLVWSPLLNSPGRVSNKLMHITDWLPTLLSAAGGDPSNLTDIDGVDQWRSLVNDEDSPRTELVINIDERAKTAAYRFGDWKLLISPNYEGGALDGYFGEHGRTDFNHEYDVAALYNSTAWKSISAAENMEIRRLRQLATVSCDSQGGYQRSSDCNPFQSKMPCLFNIREDPCETKNLVASYPNMLSQIYRRLQEQKLTLVLQPETIFDIVEADPARFNGTWSPWMA